MTTKPIKSLGIINLTFITLAAIVSLRNLPLNAELGCSSIFFLIFALVIFFIPTALVTAELASAWPMAGGSYAWTKEAFGSFWGMFTLWVSWMESIAWFPIILVFIATMFAYLISPIFVKV